MLAPIVVRAPAPRQEPPQAAAALRRSGWRSPRAPRAGAALLGAAVARRARRRDAVRAGHDGAGRRRHARRRRYGFAAGLVAGSRVALALRAAREPRGVRAGAAAPGRAERRPDRARLVLVFCPRPRPRRLRAARARADARRGRLRRRARPPRTKLPRGRGCLAWPRRAVCALAALGLTGLFAYALQPASVPPVRGADGRVVAGSIATLQLVRLGGHDQWIEIRGASAEKPVLLYLSGGPGQSDLPYSRVFFADLARDFVVVGWDQRGTGKSYPALDPATLTLDRAVADTIELTDYLRARFDERKIYLLGESWGTILGVLAAQRRPDSTTPSSAAARWSACARPIAGSTTTCWPPPPRPATTPSRRRCGASASRPTAVSTATPSSSSTTTALPALHAADSLRGARRVVRHRAVGLLGGEYTLVEKLNVVRGLADTFAVLYPQIQGIDFRRDARTPRAGLPAGWAGRTGRPAGLALEWFRRAPGPAEAPLQLRGRPMRSRSSSSRRSTGS